MTDRELMQQALDALEKLNKDGWILADFEEEVYASIEALRARLDEWERVNMHDHKEGDLGIGTMPYAAQAAMVASQTHGRMSIDPVTGDVSIGTVKPQREWKTLTDEEITACIQMGKSSYLDGFVKPLATSRAVEAKLKEKNGF